MAEEYGSDYLLALVMDFTVLTGSIIGFVMFRRPCNTTQFGVDDSF